MSQVYYTRTIENEHAYQAKSSKACGEFVALSVGDRLGDITVGYDIRHNVTGTLFVGDEDERCIKEVDKMEQRLKDLVAESPGSDETHNLHHTRARL